MARARGSKSGMIHCRAGRLELLFSSSSAAWAFTAAQEARKVIGTVVENGKLFTVAQTD